MVFFTRRENEPGEGKCLSCDRPVLVFGARNSLFGVDRLGGGIGIVARSERKLMMISVLILPVLFGWLPTLAVGIYRMLRKQ
jgi:hypothetical protein